MGAWHLMRQALGLPGSWRWAVRQLDAGRWIRPSTATGTVKYRLDDEGQRRLLWTDVRSPRPKDWSNAYFFMSDTESVVWKVVEEK